MVMSPDLTVEQAAELLLMVCHAQNDVANGKQGRQEALEFAIASLQEQASKIPAPWPSRSDIGYCVACRGIYSHRDRCQFETER